MGTLIQDLRYGARMLWRSPVFTLVAVLALALGIGATTAIYTVVDAVMLRPLPFPQPDQLTVVTSLLRHHHSSSSFPDYQDFRTRNHTLQEVAAYMGGTVVITGGSDPQDVDRIKVTPSLFRVLGVPMTLGRGFSDEEGRPGSHVVVIAHDLWKKRFNGDPAVVGKTISLDSESYTIVGVLPPRFQWPVGLGEDATELVLPYPADDNDVLQSKSRGSHFLRLIGRLKPGVTMAQAQSDFEAIVTQMKKDHPGEEEGELDPLIEPLHQVVTKDARRPMILVLVAVLCVLLIACANVAGLLLARATVRQREIAIRVALGAKRSRIVRQMLTESVLLGLVGGAVGMLLALWLVDLLVALLLPSLPRAGDITIDGPILALAVTLSALTGIIFGLVPALHASRTDLNDALKETARSTAHARNRRARNALLVGEIAGALLLLFGAGLTLRSFANLIKTNPGFHVDGLTIAVMPLPQSRYSTDSAPDQYRHLLEQQARAIPGAQAVSVGGPIPFSPWDLSVSVNPVGEKTNPALPAARYVSVSPTWFTTLGIPLLRGRTFDAIEDTLKGPPALIVSKSFAERMWPGQEAVGKHIHVGICGTSDCHGGADYTVIGVVGDILHDSLEQQLLPTMYTAFGHVPLDFVGVAVRSSNGSSMQAALRSAILAVDKDLPPPVLTDMRTSLFRSLQQQKILMILMGLFAAVALILATIGVYGVISYTVTQRTREIGIRVALGAGTGEILGLVLGESLRLSLAASVLGVGGALLGGRALESQLYGVAATDPATLIAVTLLILVVCLVAAFLPARRAAKVDPMTALRYE